MQKFNSDSITVWKLKQYQIKILNGFSALENLDDNVDIRKKIQPQKI
jgi:hypothetical protein